MLVVGMGIQLLGFGSGQVPSDRLTSVNRRGTVSQLPTEIGTVQEPPSSAAGVAERRALNI